MDGLTIRTPRPEELSRELRGGEGPDLGRRRGVVALSFLAAGAMQVVGLYQIGIIKHVPETPLPYLSADQVDASEEAYAYFWTGDAFLGLISYSITAALAAGPADRARRAAWIPLALTAKAAVDALQAARPTRDQWTKHRAFCSWCLLAAGATFAALPLTWEAREAWSAIRGKRD